MFKGVNNTDYFAFEVDYERMNIYSISLGSRFLIGRDYSVPSGSASLRSGGSIGKNQTPRLSIPPDSPSVTARIALA
jgi:hypothetical protein